MRMLSASTGLEHPPRVLPSRKWPMQAYYFDMKDGVPIKDRTGLEFPTDSQAIEHSKALARRLGHEHLAKDEKLCVVVLNEAGSEIHREPVYSDATRPPAPANT